MSSAFDMAGSLVPLERHRQTSLASAGRLATDGVTRSAGGWALKELALRQARCDSGRPVRYGVHVNGRWCLTFEWQNGDGVRVNLEQYH